MARKRMRDSAANAGSAQQVELNHRYTLLTTVTDDPWKYAINLAGLEIPAMASDLNQTFHKSEEAIKMMRGKLADTLRESESAQLERVGSRDYCGKWFFSGQAQLRY